ARLERPRLLGRLDLVVEAPSRLLGLHRLLERELALALAPRHRGPRRLGELNTLRRWRPRLGGGGVALLAISKPARVSPIFVAGRPVGAAGHGPADRTGARPPGV